MATTHAEVNLSVRIPGEFLKRAEKLIKPLQEAPGQLALGTISRNKVLRIALGIGLAALEDDTKR